MERLLCRCCCSHIVPPSTALVQTGFWQLVWGAVTRPQEQLLQLLRRCQLLSASELFFQNSDHILLLLLGCLAAKWNTPFNHTREARGGTWPWVPAQDQAGSCVQPCLDQMKNKKLLWTGHLTRQFPLLHLVHQALLCPPACRGIPPAVNN